MESLLKLIPRKSYNTFGWVALLLFLIINLVVIAVAVNFESKATLQCNPNKGIASDLTTKKYIETQCFLQYTQEFYPPFPIYALLVVNFGIVLLVSFVYAYSVSYRVHRYAESSRAVNANNVEDENQEPHDGPLTAASDPDASQNPDSSQVFILYTLHLFFRIILLLVFAAVVLRSSSNYPIQFQCSWSPKPISAPSAKVIPTRNYSLVYCTYPTGGNNEKTAVGAAIINLLFCTVALAEFAYLIWSARKYDDFRTEIEFCRVYILRKRKRIRKLMKKIRQNISEDVFHLYDDFGEKDLSRRKLEDMYVNVVIQDGRENILPTGRFPNRHSIYEAHMTSTRNANVLWKTADLFSNHPKSVLVVGRPGIGKTLLTKKIFHQWKQQKIEFWRDKIVLLIRFRSFDNERISLREMLRRSDGFTMSSKDFNHVYEYICLKSKNVIIIFDGLDELKVDEQSLDAKYVVNSHNEPMHVLSILKQLLKGKLLPGSTVLTTSRPTAEYIYKFLGFVRNVEILGFSEEQIKEYVSKFCLKDTSKSEKIFTLIEHSAELFSLCYVPVNCYIVCLTLSESIDQIGESSESNVPVTITELYKRAIKILLFKHHKQYRTKKPPKDYFISKLPELLEKDLNKLKPIARNGMEEDKLIFQLESADKLLDQLSNCGLFHKLEDKRRNLFCFLHLTIQEFLAALHVVDDMANIDEFLSEHIDNPKWYLVIQFVAGLIGDKKRELKAKSSRKAVERTDEIEKLIQSIFKRFHDSLPHNHVNVYRNSHVRVIKWLHETQDVDVVSTDVRDNNGMLTTECQLANLDIAPVDASALFGFLSCIEYMEKLDINRCTMEKYAVLELVKLLGKIRITDLLIFDSSIVDDTYRSIGYLLNNTETKLSTLTVRKNKVSTEGAKCLRDAMKSGNCKLSKLTLISNALTAEGAKFLSDALKSAYCKLTVLNLLCNKLTDEGANCLSDALKSGYCKLTELDLSSNGLTDEGAKCLSDALKSGNCKLTDLNLSINKLADEGANCLSDALKSGNCKLTTLVLLRNRLTDEGAKCFSDALKSGNCKLTELNLSINKLADEGAKCLSDALKSSNCKLTELDLSSIGLTNEGAKCLSDALKSSNCKLNELYLSDNKLTDEGGKYLSDALKSGNCKLTELDLSSIGLTNEGAKCLSDALKSSNCELTKLNLSFNKIRDEGAKCLNDALKSGNCKLTELLLSGNELTDKGAKSLSDTLKSSNCKLTELDLRNNKLTRESAKCLSDALKGGNSEPTKGLFIWGGGTGRLPGRDDIHPAFT